MDEQSPSETTIGAPIETDVKNAILRRLDGIKNRDENAVRSLIDEHYNKFDDWPSFTRQEYEEALARAQSFQQIRFRRHMT